MNNEVRLLEAIIRQDFPSFIGKVFSTINPGAKYHSNWHIDLIADYLEAARSGEIKRLIITPTMHKNLILPFDLKTVYPF